MRTGEIPKTDYSQIAHYYDRVRYAPAKILPPKIIEHGKIEANSHVLDVGCGTGRFPISLLAMKHFLCYALEPSVEMLKEAVAKDESKQILWVRGDGQQLPFKKDHFDCVYMTMVLHHIQNKEMVLREAYRVLKASGNCVIMTTSHSRIKKHVLNYFPGITAIDLKRFPPVPWVKKTMITTGFKDVHYRIVRYSEEVPTEEFLERVRNRYISTLTLLSKDAFKKGLRIFEERARQKYGSRLIRVTGFVFVVGQK